MNNNIYNNIYAGWMDCQMDGWMDGCHRLRPSFLPPPLLPSPSSSPFSHLLPLFHFPRHYLSLNPTLQFSCSHYSVLFSTFVSSRSALPPFHLVLQYSHFPSPALLPHAVNPATPTPPPTPPLPLLRSSPLLPFHLHSCAPSSARKMPSSISRPFSATPPRRRHAQAHFAEACVFILHTDANLRLKLPRGEHTLTLIQSSCQLLKA